MNKYLLYLRQSLRFALILSCAGTAVLAEPLPLIHIWSGREQVLPIGTDANWALLAEHGRELYSSRTQGSAVVNLSPLPAGAQESAILLVNKCKYAKVLIWPPEILAGFAAACLPPEGRVATELRKHGLKIKAVAEVLIEETSSDGGFAAVTLAFPERYAFPLVLASKWSEISLHRTKKSGCLSVLYDKREQVADCTGNLSYIVLKDKTHSRFLFSPDFDFQDIDNILLLKAILEEKKP